MTIPSCYIGCDISKRTLDLYDPAGGRASHIANSPEAIAEFAAELQARSALVVFEATGAYDRALADGLAAAGIAYARINPTRARRFAQAQGLLAKTDALDARMLSQLGETLKPHPDAPEDPACRTLKSLQNRRDNLVQMRADEKKRLHVAEAEVAASIADHMAWLDQAIGRLDAEISDLIARTASLQAARDLLLTAPGVGPVTAHVLLGQMSELGRLSPKKIAALAGLAPVNCDSGAMRGQRHIRGGRPRIRRALYMAALAATRTCTQLRRFYQTIKARSKSAKVAVIATARKLLTRLNAMLRDNRRYEPECN